MRLSEMQEAAGLSLSYVAAIRNGREVPHRRHWTPLLDLIERKEDRIERERSLEERWEGVDFEQDLRPGIDSLDIETIAETLGVRSLVPRGFGVAQGCRRTSIGRP